jgi:hypothetical protein
LEPFEPFDRLPALVFTISFKFMILNFLQTSSSRGCSASRNDLT